MSEENKSVEAEAEKKPPVAPEAENEAETDDDKPISHRESKKLKGEAASLRDRLKAAEDKVKASEDAALSELEKARRDIDQAQETNGKLTAATRTLLLRSAIEELKPTLGVRSPSAMAKLINTDAITFDLDSMTVEGVADELKRLKKEEPDLFVSGGTDGGAGGTGRVVAKDMNGHLRSMLGGR